MCCGQHFLPSPTRIKSCEFIVASDVGTFMLVEDVAVVVNKVVLVEDVVRIGRVDVVVVVAESAVDDDFEVCLGEGV